MKFKITLAVLVIVLSACAGGPPHRVNSEELNQEFVGKSFTNLLIIGVYKDRTFRVSGETSLAEELKSRGIAAWCTCWEASRVRVQTLAR